MLNFNDIMETITMIQEENLDIRTITMGISLLDCADSDIDRSCEKIRYSHRKQANQRYSNCDARCGKRRRSGKIRKNT